jgi:hypothetical protein
MHWAKTFGKWGGSLMVLAVGLFASGWSGRVHEHPMVVGGIFALGIILALYGFFGPQQQEGVAALSSSFSGRDNSGNFAGRDNTGHQYSSSGDLHVHHHTPGSSPPPSKALPNLKIRGYQLVMIDERPQYVIPVENMLPEDKHQPFAIARRLSVDLRFTGAYNVQIHIPRAFWHEKSFNEIDLAGGEECSFIVGGIAEGCWICRHNTHDRSLAFEESQVMLMEDNSLYDEKAARLLLADGVSLTLDIKIFSHQLQLVLLNGRYKIKQLGRNLAHLEQIL